MTLQGSVVMTNRDGVLTIKDGSGTPNTLEVTFDMGDIAINRKQNVQTIKDRGALSHLRLGEEDPLEVSFSAYYRGLAAASGITVYEALFGESAAVSASWVSTTEDASDVWTTDLSIVYSDVDGSSTETVECSDFACTEFSLNEAADGIKLSFSGICATTSPSVS